MTEGRWSRPSRLQVVSVPRAVAAFLVAGLVVLSLVAGLLAWAQRGTATAEAIRDARTLTNLEAADVVGPVLDDASLRPGPAWDALDTVVRRRVLGSHIVRVKVWDASGRVVYSDARDLVGRRFVLGADELAALRDGRTSAEVSDLDAKENVDEQQFGKLLQVYQGVRTAQGTPLLFETYQPYSVVTDASRRMWRASLPPLLAGLALLYLVQAPLAYRMARRLRRSQDEREALLVGSLATSDRERATIAADLHDGVVQGLAGASYTLAAGAARATDPEAAQAMSSAAADLRRWVRELRSLVVTITPPALHAQGLGPSLADLAATLEVRGLQVHLETDEVGPLEEPTEELLFRAAQEAVRNVVRHADARSATLALVRSDTDVTLTVRDDGRGLGPGRDGARRRGSVGLELLERLLAAQGGTLVVEDADGGGTRVTVRLPVPARTAAR